MVGLKKKLLIVPTVATVACAMGVTACGSSGDSGASGELVRVAVSDFENDALDPAMETNSGMRIAKYMMWDSLLEIGPSGEIAPGIAESWNCRRTDSRGRSTFVTASRSITVRNSAADDVKFSIDRMMAPEAATGDSTLAREQIESVNVVDADTVAIRTKGVQSALPYLLSPHQSVVGIVMPKDYLLNEGGATFEQQRELMERAPIGSGPFRFVSRTAGDSMKFEAVDNHWRRTPAIKQVEVLRVSEEATQVSMLQSGEVDVITVAPDQAATAQSAGMEIRAVENSGEVGLFFPGSWREASRTDPAGKPDVRRALSLAINRQDIIDSVLAGYADLKTTPFNTSPATESIDEAYLGELGGTVQRIQPREGARTAGESRISERVRATAVLVRTARACPDWARSRRSSRRNGHRSVSPPTSCPPTTTRTDRIS